MTEFTRRRVLEILGVGGLTVTIVLPSRWIKPVVESVVVPAHAQASPNKTPLDADRHYRYDPDDRYDRHLQHVYFDQHFLDVDQHLHFDQHIHVNKHFYHTDKHRYHAYNGAGLFDSHSWTVVCRRKASLLLMSHGAH
jgi:hypothetical protein